MTQTTKLYIHVPFCHAKCYYCDFYSSPNNKWMEGYVDAVINEWNHRKLTAPGPVDTIYLGGGTPSSLPLPLLERLLSALPSTGLREFTIEANPEDVTPEWVRFITERTSINRVSMGFQTFDDTELAAIGRRHSAAQSLNALELLRAHGISNISCDLIYGLPGQDLESWQRSLDTLIGCRPQHISAYLLSYEPGTRLDVMLAKGKVSETDEETVSQMYRYLCVATANAGYSHYEISNFALPGYEAIHNSSYWNGSPYIGIGPGAHSWDGSNRSANPSDLKRYVECRGEGFGVIEEETDSNRFNDHTITSLRTSAGLNLGTVMQKFGPDYLSELKAQAKPLIASGDLIYVAETDTLHIPESKWLVSNPILLQLIKVDDD